jgi:carbamate kinase
MRLVVALGGNALLQRGDRPDADVEIGRIRDAAAALAPVLTEHQVLLVHGNGPQVGLLALESEADVNLTRPYPLDALGAQTQGMVGYWLAQALRNAGVAGPVVSVVTQTIVDADDPAFAHPTKFVGAVYAHQTALAHSKARGWAVAADGTRWRRVVASPRPVRIVERPIIEHLLESGVSVICGGGGGAPVVEEGGLLRGVEAVVDKDWTAAILAIALDADQLVVLTDVEAVMREFGTPRATAIRQLDLDQIRDARFSAGSMAPKVAACAHFVIATGRTAAIGRLDQAPQVLNGAAGTAIVASKR